MVRDSTFSYAFDHPRLFPSSSFFHVQDSLPGNISRHESGNFISIYFSNLCLWSFISRHCLWKEAPQFCGHIWDCLLETVRGVRVSSLAINSPAIQNMRPQISHPKQSRSQRNATIRRSRSVLLITVIKIGNKNVELLIDTKNKIATNFH